MNVLTRSRLWLVVLSLSLPARWVEGADLLKKPNVLFVVIDDLNDWVGTLGGHPLVKTPNIDRLGKRGTVFLSAHCQAPLCNPSRTSVMLGLRPTTTGVYGLAPWFRNIDTLKDRVALPQHFRNQGYHTFTVGKIYHGNEELSPGEFDVAVATHRASKPPKKFSPPTGGGGMDWGPFPLKEADAVDFQTADAAVKQIKAAPKSRPFFIAAGFHLPHVPLYAPQRWFDLYPDDDTVLPKILEGDRDDTPRFSWYLHWSLPEPRLQWLKHHDQWRKIARAYLACISFMDAQVGRLIDAVDEAGLAQDTVIVLWSDHGWHLGEKAITGKNTLWERSTRVPLIFAGPGVARGARAQQPVELLDIYPTLVELCGLPRRDDLEGLSLLPQLKDAQARRERPAMTSHNQGNHAVRTDRWRYIRYADGTEELYDLKADPHEWTNLAGRPAFVSVIAEQQKWLPKIDLPPTPGSANRVLTYNKVTDEAIWEGTTVRRSDPIP